MKIAVGCDHGAYELKLSVLSLLEDMNLSYTDFGTFDAASCDYPVYASRVCKAVQSGEFEKGIIMCGTGIGVCITANKFKGIRAALCCDTQSAYLTRQHNDANVLTMGGRILPTDTALEIVRIFLTTPFSGEERHMRRIAMITDIENGVE